MIRRYPIIALFIACAAFGFAAESLGFREIMRLPHDTGAFTQGLVWHEGVFIESTGLYGQSSLRRVDPDSGEVLQIHRLDDGFFGEGCAVVDDRVIQLTWLEETAFVYDLDTFELIETHSYDGEGWGLAYDGERLIMSDGSSTIEFRDPADFSLLGSIRVSDENGAVSRLNELEWIDGEIWANVWLTDFIVCIDPADGRVIRRIDFAGLLSPEDRTPFTDALNGIAYDSVEKRILVTGKRWPYVFAIDPLETQSSQDDWHLFE